MKTFCAARHPEKLPVKAPKVPIKERSEHAAWISDGKTILLQQSTARRWVGLWRLPPLESEPVGGPAAELIYSIVRERVTLRVHRTAKGALSASAEPRNAFSLRELERIAIPSPHRRAIAKLLKDGFDHG
jgi:adenine-specific DNA glycosylase